MRFAALLALSLLPGCATARQDLESLVDNPVYEAIGGSPSWRLAIGDDIALRLGHNSFTDDEIAFAIYRYPRTLAREWEGVRRWHSTTGGESSIVIEMWSGPCAVGGGPQFEDNVRVTQGSRVLTGCGGRLIRGRDSMAFSPTAGPILLGLPSFRGRCAQALLTRHGSA